MISTRSRTTSTNYKNQFKPEYEPQVYRLNAATLDSFIETSNLSSKQAALLNRASNSEILLTNLIFFTTFMISATYGATTG
jgi:hypothetical protein